MEKNADKPDDKTLMQKASEVMDIAVLPLSLGAGAYVFHAKTGDALYDNLKNTGKLAGISDSGKIFRNSDHGHNTAKQLAKFHADWTKSYNGKLKEYGFNNVFDRFGGIHHNQRLEVIVQSVTAIGLVIGFSALLDQFKHVKKDESDKSLSR